MHDSSEMVDWRKFVVIDKDPSVATHFKFPYSYFGVLVKQSFDKGQKVLLDQITKDLKEMYKDADPEAKAIFHTIKAIIEKSNKNQATKAYWENTSKLD